MAISKQSTALNLASAAAAGVITLVRPGRFPKWARRGLRWANTAGTAGSVFLVVRGNEVPDDHPLHKALSASDVMAAASGGLMLVTSGLGLKADDKVEAFLVKHGVKHPRVLMAVGVVVVLFAVKTVQDAKSKDAESKEAEQPGEATRPKSPATSKPANSALPTAGGSAAPTTDATTDTERDVHPDTTR
jgi:hypothetical protein